VARPFRKFFNLGERPTELPVGEPFEIFDKLDGSLGILYWLEGRPRIATRGSFLSDQARIATGLMETKYRDCAFDPTLTYLFEIITPTNRIVVDYGDRDELVLLAVIETETGHELPLSEHAVAGIPVIRTHGMGDDPFSLLDQESDNAEGYVLRFQNGLRLKVKFQEYLRLHRLICGLNERHIWEALREGRSLEPWLNRVPADFAAWLTERAEFLNGMYRSIEADARAAFLDLGDRKANAERYREFAYPHLLFAMLDGKPYADMIWKAIRPGASQPFKLEV
jgi:RNA ligase